MASYWNMRDVSVYVMDPVNYGIWSLHRHRWAMKFSPSIT